MTDTNFVLKTGLTCPSFNNTGNVTSQSLTYGTTITWNLAAGKIANLTLTASTGTIGVSNQSIDTCVLHIYQDGTGGRTVSWTSNFKWPSGVAPTLSTGIGAHDIMTFVCDGTNMYGTYVNNLA